MFFSQYFSFPSQYHSSNSPYSFIHLPPTLYKVFLPVLQFPLSVSYHHAPYTFIHLPPTLYNVFLPMLQFPTSVSSYQFSILIQSSTTDVVQCFSPSTSVSPVSIIPPMLHIHSFIYHRRSIMLFSQYFSFPFQYHSINSHTHSFIYHRRCIMFSPSTWVSSVSIVPQMSLTHSFIYNQHYMASVTAVKNMHFHSLFSSL